MFSISVNGELAGFFASKRGVREGDPLSSFLFLIAMGAFSRSFSRAVVHPNFGFHPRCDGSRAKEGSVDPLEVPLGPMTRPRAKRFKEALHVLIRDAHVE